jgi:hypothetical protein
LTDPAAISRVVSVPSLMSAAVMEPFLMSLPSISVLAAKAEPVVENTSAVMATAIEGVMWPRNLSNTCLRTFRLG